MMLALPSLHGMRIQWNSTDVAEVVAAWCFMEQKFAGVTVVGHEPKTYAVIMRPCGGLVTTDISGRRAVA